MTRRMFELVARCRQRVRRAVRARALGAISDDVLLREFASRLNRPAGRSPELLAKLVDQMHRKVAGEFGERFMPVRELDYARHRIKLVLSSPSIAVRLDSAEKEPFTVEWIEQSLKPGDVFYDIGANVGAYSLIAAKATSQGVRVFAFEPSPPTFNDLCRNVLLNGCGGSVVPVPLALWSETGLLDFTFRSLDPGAARHRVNRAPASQASLTQAILGVRLDDFIERFELPLPTHAKIDVDGAEIEVLRGAERTLAGAELRSILVELDSDETERNHAVMKLLGDHGFGAGHRYPRVPSRRYPRPHERPDVYWSFSKEVA